MWFNSLLAFWKSGVSRSRRPQPRPARRGTRLVLEQLENRNLPSNYSAASVSALIADITAANTAGGSNTITLTAPTTSPYVLTAVNNTTTTYGPNGLPVIAANDNLTIIGNGDTIERSTAGGTPDFRLFDVASGASLTLENLTLQGGVASAPPAAKGGRADGGAIYSLGTLVLNGVTVQNNEADGAGGAAGPFDIAMGGGIFAGGGSVTLKGGTLVQNNTAVGGTIDEEDGYNAYGGGLYASDATVTVTSSSLDDNTAVGGYGVFSGYNFMIYSEPGSGYGGGLYASGGMVTLTNATLNGNSAESDGNGGLLAYGGGLYLDATSATLTNCTVQDNAAVGGTGGTGGGLYISGNGVALDAATVAQVTNNTPNNIVGPYTLT